MQPLLRHLSRHRGQSRGLFPDLRYSGALASQEVFNSIVLDGALTRNGMVSFSKALTPEDVYDLRAYPTSRPLDAQKNGSGGMFPGQPARGASAQAANSPPAHQIGHLEATH